MQGKAGALRKMVKKISQSTTPKISKDEKLQLSCSAKVLKPKVYIIDSSNFKRVVQELTGHVNTKQHQEPIPIVDLGDGHGQEPILEATISMEAAISVDDASLDSSEWCNYQPCFPEDQLVETNYNSMNYVDDVFLDVSSMNQQTGNLFQYQGVDQSWLFDLVEQPSPSFCNGFGQHIEQEVSIYDYGYSG